LFNNIDILQVSDSFAMVLMFGLLAAISLGYTQHIGMC